MKDECNIERMLVDTRCLWIMSLSNTAVRLAGPIPMGQVI
jgi:hypothetical protein